MGRKKKDIGVKEKRITIRVSEALYEVIKYSAKKSGLSLAEYCRRAVLNQPIKKLPVIIHDEKEIAQALRNIDTNISRRLSASSFERKESSAAGVRAILPSSTIFSRS